MDDKAKKIIIKKVKKTHGGHHGGSWKVAYADFVTAMMAFFLMLWLLSMVAPEKRAVLAAYFKDFSLYEKGGKSFMMDGGQKPTLQHMGGAEVLEAGDEPGSMSKEELAAKIMGNVQDKIEALKDQVQIEMTDEGIRIQIVDTRENPIFPAGSPQMTESGKRIIKSLSEVLKNFRNELAVEGHTDGSPTKNEQMSNWELSTARASFARKELEVDGIEANRIARVVGFADKAPFIKEHPEDPRNRRISILFLKGKKIKPVGQFDWLWKEPPAK